jgi:DnaJ-domain-containing protein 1
MSIWRRAVTVAKANLNDLARRASNIGSGHSLGAMSDEELEAEIARRRAERAAKAAVDQAKERSSRRSEPTGSSEGGDPQLGFLAELSPKRRRELKKYYANLELPFGASREEVKQAYRRLMRQYHPDKHQQDPARRQLATELSQKLTAAYNELTRVLREAEKTK